MLTVLAVIGAVLVLFVAAVIATRDGGELQPAPPDAADVLAPCSGDEVRAVRFSMAPRGYRMAEVDQVMDQLAEELDRRDARIAELAATGGSVEAPHVEMRELDGGPVAAPHGEARELDGGPAAARDQMSA